MDAAHIGVTANAGVVTLTGHVANYTHKLGAEKAASRVRGVKAVAEEIEVKLPYDIKPAMCFSFCCDRSHWLELDDP